MSFVFGRNVKKAGPQRCAGLLMFLDNSLSCSNYCMTLFVSKALTSRTVASIVGIVSLN